MTERDLFLAAIEIVDPVARQSYLDGACGNDEKLRAGVEELLRASSRQTTFLKVPALRQMLGGGESSAVDRVGSERGEVDLARYLEPSTRPNALGRLAHYDVLEILGTGGFGVVLKAFDEKLERVVAIKLLHPELSATSPPRKRFLREARLAAAVRDDQIVAIFAVEEQPLPYLVMEYIPGCTLQQYIDDNGPLETADVVRIGCQIANGLAAAHAAGLIHRDVKPANILLDSAPIPRAKLTDFGLARATDDASMTQSGVVAGTPMYMAPEQARGLPLDQRADLFSLGSVLYVMLTGRPPFRASTTLSVLKRVCEDTPRPIREIVPEVPEWLCALVTRLQQKQPHDRPTSAHEVADLLARCHEHLKQPHLAPVPAELLLETIAPTSSPPDAATSSGGASQRSPRGLKHIGTIMLVVLAIAVWLWWRAAGSLPSWRESGGLLFLLAALMFITGRLSEYYSTRHQATTTAVRWYRLTTLTCLFAGAAGLLWWIVRLSSPSEAPPRNLAEPARMIRLADTVLLQDGSRPNPRPVEIVFPPSQVRDKTKISNSDQSGWTPLFNGEDLTGWKTHPEEPGDWHVADGLLVGSGRPSVLFTEAGDYTDFDVRMEARINDGGDSGLLVRTTFVKPGPLGSPGYEAQIQAGKPLIVGWTIGAIGGTFPETGWRALVPSPAHITPLEWFELEVRVHGNEIETWLNGQRTAWYVDPDHHYKIGHITLQKSGGNTQIEIRKLDVRRIPPKTDQPKP